ncbi:MAG: hypothetical protein ACRD0W_02185 [Acidimicrobiales bacterium]
MLRVPSRWFADQVEVESRTGTGASGPIYDPPVQVRCHLQQRRQLVRDADGREVVSESTVRVPPGPDAALLSAESKVTTADGRTAMVIGVRHHMLRGRLVYVEAALT